MAQFELNIYGKDDEVVKRYESDRIRWGLLMQAFEIQEKLESLPPAEQFTVIADFVKKIFPAITDEELENADIRDVFSLFKQITSQSKKIGGNSKN